SYFLGIDFGTSGARACVIAEDKSVCWEQRVSFADAANQTPQQWREALETLLAALPPALAKNLHGIALDGTSGTVLLCDADLAPVSPVLLYNDSRAALEAAQLKTLAPNNHIVCSASSGLAKFLWLTQRYPDAQHFLHQADWLTAQLTGVVSSDYHNALKTGYDVANLCWPAWAWALPNAKILPKVVAPGALIATITPDVAARFGIHHACKIYAGTTDSIAAFMASEVHETNVGVTSLGTTLVLKQLSRVRVDASEYGIYSHRYGDLWLLGGASNAGAGVLNNYFDDAQLAALSTQIDAQKNSPLDYYPLSKTGERFPVNDANFAPRLSPRPDDDAEFLHGMLQGLARIEAEGYAKLNQLGAGKITRIVSCGGGAKNPTWQAIRARQNNVAVNVAAHSEAAYGVALLAQKSAA
ncbi:MAG: FGGY-family carbohydrate kinase, partial [Sideroxydans sp.]|nr:FGGY-family carbohydrate kinase [Sideroxydans sp.]